MRPRHYTAENEKPDTASSTLPEASMRPRHYTAENQCSSSPPKPLPSCFNEAAALHRGKRTEPPASDGNTDPLQ